MDGPEAGTTAPNAGGTTEDFGGSDLVQCEDELQLEHHTVSPLGFSANDVLATIVGNYEFRIVWFNRCLPDNPCGYSCDTASEEPVSSFAGSMTTLTIELAATGEPALVPQPGPGQTLCGTHMSIPATMLVRSADGAVDAGHDVIIWTERGDHAEVSINGPAAIMGGAVATELPEDTAVALTFGTFDERAWLDIYFTPPRDLGDFDPPLLEDAILSDEACPHDVPIDEVRLP